MSHVADVRQQRKLISLLIKDYGLTYAEEAHIKLKDTPAPLFQLLILSLMLSARIAADKAVSATQALFKAGLRTPDKMLKASWQDRVDTITWAGYKRYDEKTATMLGKTAELLVDTYQGDLRRLHDEAHGDVDKLHEKLQQFSGIGATGADIFLREVQSVWKDVYPYIDKRTQKVAASVGLPADTKRLQDVCPRHKFPALTASLIRVKLSKQQKEVRDKLK